MPVNAILHTWQDYAAAWTLPPGERMEKLRMSVAPDVEFFDASQHLIGQEALAEFMEKFRGNLSEANFVIQEARMHHEQSIANWQLMTGTGENSELLLRGTSFGRLNDQGLFDYMAGFMY